MTQAQVPATAAQVSTIDNRNGQEALFDMVAIEQAAVSASPWDGIPLTYVASYHTPAELQAGFDRWIAEHGNFGCITRSHMWHENTWRKNERLECRQHLLVMLDADTRTATTDPYSHCAELGHDHQENPLPEASLHQANCEPCRWHHIDKSENACVEAFYDHALPGWRNLPLLPHHLQTAARQTKPGKAKKWMEANYPRAFLIQGTPIITHRQATATRHVPGRSPYGGYDIAAEGINTTDRPTPTIGTRDQRHGQSGNFSVPRPGGSAAAR